jgi:hypothetical protein
MKSNYPSRMRYIALMLFAGVVLAACGTEREVVESSSPGPPTQSLSSSPTETELPSNSSATESPEAPGDPANDPTVAPDLINTRNFVFDSYLPPQLIPLDGIRPVYNPQFVEAVDAPLLDDELVIGVSVEGETKAYPITVLRFREMVNDELGRLPILVTW